MGLSGLFLITFLIAHLSGNLLLFNNDGGVSFNHYTKFMTTSPLIRVAEWILFLGFIVHIAWAIRLSIANKKARPQGYAYSKGLSASSSWASRNMLVTGMIVLVFLIIHLYMFWGLYKFGDGLESVSLKQAYEQAYKVKEDVFLSGISTPIVEKGSYIDLETFADLEKNQLTNQKVSAISMYGVVKNSFSRWYIVIFYVIAVGLLAFHLNHGFQSAFQTMGWVHKKYTPAVKLVGKIFAIAVPFLFGAIPLWFFFTQSA